MCGKYKNINCMIMTRELVSNSILSPHLGRGMVNSVIMVKFGQNGKLGHSCNNVMKSRFYDFQARIMLLHI